jgi:hypothetical protein
MRLRERSPPGLRFGRLAQIFTHNLPSRRIHTNQDKSRDIALGFVSGHCAKKPFSPSEAPTRRRASLGAWRRDEQQQAHLEAHLGTSTFSCMLTDP